MACLRAGDGRFLLFMNTLEFAPPCCCWSGPSFRGSYRCVIIRMACRRHLRWAFAGTEVSRWGSAQRGYTLRCIFVMRTLLFQRDCGMMVTQK